MEWLIAVVVVFLWIAVVLAFCEMFKRAGFSALLGLLCLVPVVGVLAAFCLLAFRDWPALNSPLQSNFTMERPLS